MLSFPIPVVAAPRLGPGSQPIDEIFQTLDVPTEVHTFRPPVTDFAASPEVAAAALDFLRQLLAALRATPYGAPQPVRFSLLGLDERVRAEINALLGTGEVAVQCVDGPCAQETAFTGIWRIRDAASDDVEAAAFPTALRARALARRCPDGPLPAPTDGLMNAPALQTEICALSAAHAPGAPAQVLNLSLLPVTPEDMAWLDAVLGRAGFSILSRGFGNCRITATTWPHVWWVQYFNAMEKLILNSIEVVDLPEAALAAAEDYAQSIERLDEWIVSLESAL